MNARVFLSYRRSDAAGDAGRLSDAIKAERPSWDVFIDVDEVTPGSKYTTDVQKLILSCDALLAVIGPTWLTASDERSGLPRLLDPGDLLRLEVITALDSGLIVAPVLVRGAQLPRPSEVPQALTRLAVLHATALHHTSFRRDTLQLVEGLERGLAARPKKSRPTGLRAEPRWDPKTMPTVKPLGGAVNKRSFELTLFEGADPVRLDACFSSYDDGPSFAVGGAPLQALTPVGNHVWARARFTNFWFTSPDGFEHMIQVYMRLVSQDFPLGIVGVRITCDRRIVYP